MVIKSSGNYFTQSIERQVAEAIKALGEQIPEILADAKDLEMQWKALVKVADLYYNLTKSDIMHKHAKFWLMIKGQNVIWDNSAKLKTENIPLEFYITTIEISDWPLVKHLLLNMPTAYVERYLVEEISKKGLVQHFDYYKIFSQRDDEWGQYPASWIQKVYGVRKNG
jgi:hypothetical protein